jgi:CDGSH-type Zn-finger protein
MVVPNIPSKQLIIMELEDGDTFCDGSHKGGEFDPRKVTIDVVQKVAWCACKHSKNPLFCDGSHTSF